MVMTHTDAIVVPYGAATRFVGTNPIAFGFPSPSVPFILDISTSTIAYGKIALARKENRRIPKDWALDECGRPTTEPRAVAGMHPMAKHKGSGLALTIDVFCALMTGMPFGPHINRMYFELERPRRLGHFMTFWDVSRFIPLEEFKQQMERMTSELHELSLFKGFKHIYYPGEIEGECRCERIAKGIPLEEGLYKELSMLGERLEVQPPNPINGSELKKG
jgi:ureidoglycolate dehydrogenase (NAD+)